MDIQHLARTWDELGQTDPLWAILTIPEKRGNRWDTDEFFETGRRNVERIMTHLRSLRLEPRRGTALDFGCGVGRLTQALAPYFEVVYGVDIAPSMIELARQLNRCGDRCRYRLNQAEGLRLFDDNTIDFI